MRCVGRVRLSLTAEYMRYGRVVAFCSKRRQCPALYAVCACVRKMSSSRARSSPTTAFAHGAPIPKSRRPRAAPASASRAPPESARARSCPTRSTPRAARRPSHRCNTLPAAPTRAARPREWHRRTASRKEMRNGESLNCSTSDVQAYRQHDDLSNSPVRIARRFHKAADAVIDAGNAAGPKLFDLLIAG
jgi:hypothetical protein